MSHPFFFNAPSVKLLQKDREEGLCGQQTTKSHRHPTSLCGLTTTHNTENTAAVAWLLMSLMQAQKPSLEMLHAQMALL